MRKLVTIAATAAVAAGLTLLPSQAQAAASAPVPPVCNGQNVRRYTVGPSLDFQPWRPFVVPGIVVRKHTWYGARPLHHPRSRNIVGWTYKYNVFQVGREFAVPLPWDREVFCRHR